MPAKHWLVNGIQKVSSRSRTITLSMLLIAILAQTIQRSSLLGASIDVLLGFAYLFLIWTTDSLLTNNQMRITAVLLLWILTVLSWLAFNQYQATIVLIFYLAAYIALRLPGAPSIILAVGIIIADAVIWLYTQQTDLNEILTFTFIHAGIYGFFWGARTRREASDIRKQHYQELSEMHTQLEQAHEALQLSHKELEEAAVQSLRYAVLEERTRIARDIHDSIGHGLTSVIVQLQALPYMIRMNSDEADHTLASVLNVTRSCLTEVRTVVHQMAIDNDGLGLLALRSLSTLVQEQSGLRIPFTVEGKITPWKPEIAEMLYRILQEALTNVIRHAEASTVEITISESDQELVLTIKDDGELRADTPLVPGFGLSGMQARSERAGGSFQLQTIQPHGLMIAVKVPLHNSPLEGGDQNRQAHSSSHR